MNLFALLAPYYQTSKAVCYEVECDSTNKNIIVRIGAESIKCPTEGMRLILLRDLREV